MLVREVQRLTSEVKRLRARVEAFEKSRWWRLHPRFLVRRTRPARTEPVSGPAIPVATGEADLLACRFREEVVERGTFTHDWFLHQIGPWEPLFRELEGCSARLLEIGSFEGFSACYMLWRLPDAQLTCIDTFAGSVEHAVSDTDLATLEEVFMRNVTMVDASRVRTMVDDSRRALLDLAAEEQRCDLVYVDGSHLGLDVLVDTALAWRLVTDGGFLVWDDYGWKGLGEDALLRPGPAIDAFLGLVEGKYELLRRDVQVAVRKVG